MGTYSKSNFGKISGKVGEGVGGNWRGINYLRSLPTKSKKGPTASQLAIRAKFALSAAQLSPIKDVLNIGFRDKNLTGLSGYNAAAKAFITNSILGQFPDYTVDYSRMQVSKGSLSPLAAPKMEHNSELSITWKFQTNAINSFPDDQVLVLIYNQTTNLYMIDDSATRSASGLSIDIGADPGEIVHAWVFCINRDGTTVSPSEYIGSLTL